MLVTGGGGFIGAALTRWLLARGHRVTALDTSFIDDRLPTSAEGLRIVEGSVLDDALVRSLVAESGRVAHLAAIAGVHHYLERTQDVLDTNILGTRSVLLAAAEHARPVLFASTSETYGKSAATLFEEGDSVLGPTTNARWSYAVSKLAGEHYAWAFARAGLPVTAVRFFNVYGPLLDRPGEGRVLAQFLGRLRAGEPLVLVDGGTAVRCLCYIDDAIEAAGRMLEAVGPNSPLVGRPFNVGRDEPVTMRELAERVCALADHAPGTKVESGTRFFGVGFEDIAHRVPDVSALEAAIGWRATTSLDQGLRKVLAHHGLLAHHPGQVPLPPLPVIRPTYDADEALITQFRTALNTGRTSNGGPQVTALEAEAATWLGAPSVHTVASGADGLELAVRALGVRGKALLPAFTYISTLNAAELVGLEPVFADIDAGTWTVDPSHVAALLDAHPDISVVFAVNVFGVPPDLDALASITRSRGVRLIYDAAHAVGTTHLGRRYVDTPDVTVWSLHATKVLPSTEGGLMAAPHPAVHARLAQLRTHGLAADPLDSVPGRNAKMDELAAATARHGLQRLEATLDRRRAYTLRLCDALTAAGWRVQQVPVGVEINGQNLAARAPGHDLARAASILDAHGVGSRRYFFPPLHALRRFGATARLPVTEAVVADLLNVPLYARMGAAELERIEAAILASAAL